MKLNLIREELLTPLQFVSSVVERKQTMPILSNILLEVSGNTLTLTGSDLEVQLISSITLGESYSDFSFTVPARKFFDICRSLPEGANLEISDDDGSNYITIISEASKFKLSPLAASDFPKIDEQVMLFTFSVSQSKLRSLIDAVSFSMAQNDVRYYLNGILFEVEDHMLRVVATDGHRLAMSETEADIPQSDDMSIILPRKSVMELARLLTDPDDNATVNIGDNYICVDTGDFNFTSRLVDGKFPEYRRVIPSDSGIDVIADRRILKEAFIRMSILSNGKYKGVSVSFNENEMKLVANNPEQEVAEEVVPVNYQGEAMEMGFNISYLQDVISVISTDTVKITLTDKNKGVLFKGSDTVSDLYVVMPMKI